MSVPHFYHFKDISEIHSEVRKRLLSLEDTVTLNAVQVLRNLFWVLHGQAACSSQV